MYILKQSTTVIPNLETVAENNRQNYRQPFMKHQRNNILFIGFTASGKSVTGKRVAERLSHEFIDIDIVIEDLHQKNGYPKKNYREIYAEFGLPYFKSLELQALTTLVDRSNIVIAPGGGVLEVPESRSLLKRIGTVIYLATDPEIIFKRMQTRGFPLYLANDQTLDNVKRHWELRRAVYEATGDYRIDNSHLTPDQTVEAVLALYTTNLTMEKSNV